VVGVGRGGVGGGGAGVGGSWSVWGESPIPLPSRWNPDGSWCVNLRSINYTKLERVFTDHELYVTCCAICIGYCNLQDELDELLLTFALPSYLTLLAVP